MPVHWAQVRGSATLPRGTRIRLRTAGAIALGVSLYLRLIVDHVSMASLVWFMVLAAAAMAVAFTLAWRPRLLAVFVPRVRAEHSPHADMPS